MYIITQWGPSPLDLACDPNVIKILKKEEKKLKK